MQRNPSLKSGNFNSRILSALALFSVGIFLAVASFAAAPRLRANGETRSIQTTSPSSPTGAAGTRVCVSMGERVTLSVLTPNDNDTSRCFKVIDPELAGNFTMSQSRGVAVGAALGTINTAAGSAGNGPGRSLGQLPLNVTYANGALYSSDFAYHNVVRRLDLATGQQTVVAGNGGRGFNGDGPATSVEMSYPWGVALDSSGNIFIADGRRIRRVDPAGQMVTVATLSAGPQGGIGASGIAFDNQGKLLIADLSMRILRLDVITGDITVVAGNGTFGYNGDNQPATSAQLAIPRGVAVDVAGNIYIADTSNHRIRKVDASGIITTFAGTGSAGFSGDGGPAVAAQIFNPSQLSFDAAGNLYFVDEGNGRVRKIDISGVITTVAGAGFAGTAIPADGVPALSARFNQPFYGVTVTPDGTIFIADTNGSHVWQVDQQGPMQGLLQSVAGNGTLGESGDGGPAVLAQTFQADSVTFDSAGNYYIADWVMSVIRKVKPDGTITTVAGLLGGNQYLPTGYRGYNGDNIPATQAKLWSPAGMAVDAAGNLYIADSFSSRIRKVDTAGIIHTVAGTGTAGYSGDGGPATQAQIDTPNGVAVDSKGNLYIADTGTRSINFVTLGGNRIRKVTPDGIITTIVGNGVGGYNGDGVATISEVNGPYGVAVDRDDSLYIADTFNSRIRKIDMRTLAPVTLITTVAGNGTAGFSGDGGPAASAQLYYPTGVSIDPRGQIAIADPYYSLQRVRMVDASGNINTIAGNGTAGLSGDGGPATQAMLSYPGGVAFDLVGNVFIADGTYPSGNNRIREVLLVNPVPLTAVVSRKVHGNAGTFDVDLPLTGPRGIECRTGGANGNYTIVFKFANPLTSVGAARVSSGTGSVSSSAIDSDPHQYVVNLTGVTNAQVLTVSLTNVNDSAGNSSNAVSASMALLVGDSTADTFVNSADISQTKSQSGQAVSTSNFREDVTVDGSINSADISLVKSKSGTGLP